MEPKEAMYDGVEVLTVERSFEDFFELEQERLLRVIWLVTGSLQEAEDIVQDAFSLLLLEDSSLLRERPRDVPVG